MIKELIAELDKVAGNALKQGAQPITAGSDVAYVAGMRIGVSAGIQLARQAILDFYSKDTDKDSKL